MTASAASTESPRPPPASADVVVVGAGPAGFAVAAACAASSLVTVVVDPDPTRPWPQTFGAWADELPGDVDAPLLARSWNDVRVETQNRSLALGRRYVLLDNAALSAGLRRALEDAGGLVVAGRVRGFRVDSEPVRGAPRETQRFSLRLDVDRTLHARAVIDASGHRPALVMSPVGPPPALQTAHGVIGRFARPPAAPGATTFMDLTPPPGTDDGPFAGVPSFLYAMDLGGDRWLVEETCLAARPAMPISVLSNRLDARLAARGAPPATVEATERVAFPMGAPLPFLDQPVIGFGAAAGMVHPATGFSVARSLRMAPRVAEAVTGAVRAGLPALDVARAGWSAVWTADALRQRALHNVGLAALLSLDAVQLQAFFEAFFRLPRHEWTSYMSGSPSAGALAKTMLRVFLSSPGSVRLALARAVAAHPGRLASVMREPPATS